jgi:hypothetical protein
VNLHFKKQIEHDDLIQSSHHHHLIEM